MTHEFLGGGFSLPTHRREPATVSRSRTAERRSYSCDLLGLHAIALLASLDFEGHWHILRQCQIARYIVDMNEHVALTIVTRDEAPTFIRIEELDLAVHAASSL